MLIRACTHNRSSMVFQFARVCHVFLACRLQSLADTLVSRFSASGLMPQQFDRVKLHVTLINSLFRKDPSDTAAPAGHQREPRRDRESFNATNILKVGLIGHQLFFFVVPFINGWGRLILVPVLSFSCYLQLPTFFYHIHFILLSSAFHI